MRAPEPPEKIAARSMCPTCDGRPPKPGEEAYASCLWCNLPEDEAPLADVIEHPAQHPAQHSADSPRTRIA